MPFSPKKISSNNPPANELASQSTQQPQPVTWSAHAPQSPFPRGHPTLTANAASKIFIFGCYVHSGATCSDLYMFSTRDFSTTLIQTSGEVPIPRTGHGAALIGTTFLICGGESKFCQSVLNHDSLYLLNFGTSDPFMSSSTPADHSFALKERESGPALWSMAPGRAIVLSIAQT
jgi:hypothetical protein